MKVCRTCGKEKNRADFYAHRASGTNAVKSDCKSCHNLNLRVKRYGITVDDYYRILDSQGNMCAICATPLTSENKQVTPHIDHCHDSGRVRGILCNPCNRGIGYLKDDARIMLSAAEYIRRET